MTAPKRARNANGKKGMLQFPNHMLRMYIYTKFHVSNNVQRDKTMRRSSFWGDVTQEYLVPLVPQPSTQGREVYWVFCCRLFGFVGFFLGVVFASPLMYFNNSSTDRVSIPEAFLGVTDSSAVWPICG